MLGGHLALLVSSGRCPSTGSGTASGASAVAPRPQVIYTEDFLRFKGTLGDGLDRAARQADPEAKGIVERTTAT